MKSTSTAKLGLVLAACVTALTGCSTTTRVIEIHRNVESRPAPHRTVVYRTTVNRPAPSKKAPPPSEFRVINQYDQR